MVLLDKQVKLLEQVYDEIEAAGGPTPAIYPLDLKGASVPDYARLAETITTTFGRLDAVVHCAASLGQLAPVVHQDHKIWLETLHINLTAAYLLTRACLPLLREQDQSSLIFSTDEHKHKAYWGAYGISKAGIEALSLQLADELEAEGRVHVHCVDPGRVQTALLARAFPAIDPAGLKQPDEAAQTYLSLLCEPGRAQPAGASAPSNL